MSTMLARALLLLPATLCFAIAGCSDSRDASPYVHGSPKDGGRDADKSDPDPDSGRVESDVDSGGVWTPAALAQLVLWLDASRGVEQASGGKVSRWSDRSTHGNDAVPNASAAAPALVADGINGHPALRFDGQSDFLSVADSASLHFGSGDFFIAVAFAHTTPVDKGAGYGCVFSKQETTGTFLGPSLWGNNEMRETKLLAQLSYHDQYADSKSAGYNEGDPIVTVMQRRTEAGAARLLLRINGAASAEVPLRPDLDIDAADEALTLGGTRNPNQFLRGEIAEIIAVRDSVDDADVKDTEMYLTAKYLD